MSSHLKAELAATCSSLGRFHKGEYLIEPDCVESVKDLIRYLKRDNESHEIRRYLGESKVLQNDLVHIIKSCPEENSDLFDVTLRLLINLTTPTMIFYREEIPTEKIGRNVYLSLIGYAQGYKAAFCDVEFWSKICGKLTNLFETDWSERSANDGIQIERILLLLRNVLQIPADEENEKTPENDITVHDKVLWALKQSQTLELLLFLSSNRNEEQYFLCLLEIVSLILREQNTKLLAKCDMHRSEIEKTKDSEDLVKVREFEKLNRNKYKNVRNFSATFIMRGVKSLSDNDVVCHKFPDEVDLLKPNRLNKKHIRIKKNLIPIESERLERRSTFSIRLFLKEFCVEFLTCAFIGLMNIVKSKLVSGKSLPNDQSYYFWALNFFLEFAVSSNSDLSFIQDVISMETFHFVLISMDNAFEHLFAEKKKNTDWVKRIHLILKAYHSLLETLLWMDCSKNVLARSVSREIKSQVFCVTEYREMTLNMLLRYDSSKFSVSYLRDTIETAHLFIKLLEEHSRQTKLVIQKVVKKRSKVEKNKEVVKESQEDKWEKIKDDVYDILCSESHFPEMPPFDAALEIPIDGQKEKAMKNIQMLLHQGRIRDGIGLFRSARQVWPENDFFGSNEMSIEDETVALQEICIANLCDVDCGKVPSQFRENEGDREEVVKNKGNEEEEEEEEKEKEKEESPNQAYVVEKNFNIMDYKKRLVNQKIIEGCGILLKNYRKNSDHTNHCIIKFLYRIGWECCMPAMLYQASLFWTLLKILQDKSRKYSEINTFTANLLRRFRKHATEHPVVFLDLLFWKDYKVALEIQHGYQSYPDKQNIAERKKKVGNTEVKRKSTRKQKKVSDDGISEKQRDTVKRKTGNQNIYTQISKSDDFHVVDVAEDENESSVYHQSRSSRILFKDNSDSDDDDQVISNFDENIQLRVEDIYASPRPNEDLKNQKFEVSKFRCFDNDKKVDYKNSGAQKCREPKKLIDDETELNSGREFVEECEKTSTSSKNLSGSIIYLNDHEVIQKRSKSDLVNLSTNIVGNNDTKDQTLDASLKKQITNAKNKKESKVFGKTFSGSDLPKSKRIRYVLDSSDSDNCQSENEDLIPANTKKRRKTEITESSSGEDDIVEAINNK